MPLRTALFDDDEPAPGQQRPLFDDDGDDLAFLRSGGAPPVPPDGEGSPADALLNEGLSSALQMPLDAGDGFFDIQRRRHTRPAFNQAPTGDFMDIDCFDGLFGGDHSSSQVEVPAALDVVSSLASGASAPDYRRTELQLSSGFRRVLVRSTTGQPEAEHTIGKVAGGSPANDADAFAKAMASLDLDAGHSPSNEALQHSPAAMSQEQTAKSSWNRKANVPSPTMATCSIAEGNLSCRNILRVARMNRRTPLIGPWQVFEHERYGALQAPAMQATSASLSGPWKDMHVEAMRLVASAQTSAMGD